MAKEKEKKMDSTTILDKQTEVIFQERNKNFTTKDYLKKAILFIMVAISYGVSIWWAILGLAYVKLVILEYVPDETNYPIVESVEVFPETDAEELEMLRPIHSTIETVDEKEITLLAAVITEEAGGCDILEQKYVGTVVLNRVESEDFPNTLEGVVFQTGQYQSAGVIKRNRRYTETAYQIALDLLYGFEENVLPEDVVFQSQEPLGKIYYYSEWGHYYCSKY